MMDTVLNLGLNDAAGRGARGAHRQRALRVGLLPAARADVRRRRARRAGRALRGRDRARSSASAASRLDTELDADALRELTAPLPGALRLPAGPARAARAGHPRGLRLVDGRARGRLPAHQRHPRRLGHGGQRPADGLRQQGPDLGLRRGLLARRGHRRARAERRLPDRRAGRGRRLRRAHAARPVRARATGCPRRTPSCSRSCARSSATTATCRTPSSRSRTGRLYMLQTRNAKRPAQAAVRFAVDAVDEGLLTPAEAIATIDARSLHALLHPTFDPAARYEVVARGVAASPGAAKGAIVFTAPDAVAAAEEGRDVILVRPFTEADDVAGFHAAKGILTSEGGKASHAALVARGMGRPAVTGAGDAGDRPARPRGAHRRPRAARGRPDRDRRHDRRHHARRRPARHARGRPALRDACSSWCDELRTLGVRANADTPEDARRARALRRRGHRAVPDRAHVHGRRPPARRCSAMIMADDEAGRRAALDELLPLQQDDFEGMFEAMEGLPVTIRLLDPPLHEFMPDRFELVEQITEARLTRRARAGASSSTRSSACARSRRATRCSAPAGVRLGLDPPRDLRDAGARDLPRRARGARAHRPRAARRDHDPARRLRPRARAGARRSCCASPSRRASRPVATSASAR